MESNRPDNYGKEQQQPQKGARKRKLNESANENENDEQLAAEECQEEPQPENCSKKNRQQNEQLDLELESLSREEEELIKMVRKQMHTNQNEEDKKQLEATEKEEAEESANANQQQQAKAKEDMIRDMDELKMAFFTSQQKLEEVNAEMEKLNANYQKLFERIVQLPQEEEATGNVTGKQITSPIRHPMKIQLAKETWFFILGWVPRRRLGQIVPQIGDRQFAASIGQPFLHNYGHITLANISITGPRHRLIQHSDVPMPENIADFQFISLRYLSTSVVDLLEKFQQKFLFRNVNLDLCVQRDTLITKNTLLQTLSHVLPFIDNINTIQGADFAQLVNLYNSNNELTMAMLEMTRFLAISIETFHFEVSEIALLNRWLYTPRDDGRPRVLILPLDYYPTRPNQIPQFIDGTKKEFAKAKRPVSFFILLFVSDIVEWHDTSMENATSKEMLVIKKVDLSGVWDRMHQKMALVSRYPMGADKQWIEANERETMEWNYHEQNGRIFLPMELYTQCKFGTVQEMGDQYGISKHLIF